MRFPRLKGAPWRNGGGILRRLCYTWVALLTAQSAAIGECARPEVVTMWGSYGSGPGQFLFAFAIAVDPTGDFYVVDNYLDRVQKFDADGNYLFGWGTSGPEEGNFAEPTGVAVDHEGNVYVTDRLANRVQKFDSSGAFIRRWGFCCSGQGNFDSPGGVTVRGNYVYVVDKAEGLQKFDLDGTFVSRSAGSSFDTPSGVAVDSNWNVFVVDVYANTVTKFDSAGAEVMSWGSYGTGPGEFNYPQGIGVNSAGDVYVMDTLSDRVQVFDNNGSFLCKWGTTDGTDGIRLIEPRGIIFGDGGRIDLCDSSRVITLQTITPVSPIRWGEVKEIYRR